MNNRNRPKPIIGNRRPPQQKPVHAQSEQAHPADSSLFSNNRTGQRRKVKKRYTNFKTSKPNEYTSNQMNYSGSGRIQNGYSNTPAVKSSKHFWPRILLSIVLVFVLLLLSVFCYAKFSNLNPKLSRNPGLYNISNNAVAVAAGSRIVNVAVFGVDGREDVDGERSDTIIIGTADFEHNKLQVTSLMRDTYTEMADYDYFDKLNAAYSLGGPQEALKTINLNFDTAITDYVVVDFTALVVLVNAVGGIDIEITSEDELYWLNQYLMDVNDKVKTADPDVPGTGLQHLTGSQALAYARIRYVGNGDFERTQRQRTVLAQVVSKVFALNPIEQIKLVRTIMPFIETSLSTSEIIKLGLNFVLMSDREIQQSRLPVDEYSATGYLSGVSYVFPNTLIDNIKSWYQFVYGIDYTPSPTATEISEEIEETWW